MSKSYHKHSQKKCGRCKSPRCLAGYRYCPRCLSIIKKEMKETGYLQSVPNNRGTFWMGEGV